jgi:hypothetical protein
VKVRGIVLIHDNACPHTARQTQTLLRDELHWETFDHPPYSISECPSYFKLTCSMNNWKLKHIHLQSIITAKQNRLLPIGVGKCQHLPKWFGIKAQNGSFYKFFSDFYHLTMANAGMYQ